MAAARSTSWVPMHRRFAPHDFHDVAERFVGEVGQLGAMPSGTRSRSALSALTAPLSRVLREPFGRPEPGRVPPCFLGSAKVLLPLRNQL